jgi:hypothetical protein
MSSVVKISLVGNLGNQMLQLMLARSIAERVPGLEVVGYDIPEWGLKAPAPSDLPPNTLILKGQYVDFEMIISLLKHNRISAIDLSALGFQLDHYLSLAAYKSLFPLKAMSGQVYHDDVLLINVRGAEILGNTHQDYGPIPLAFYRQLITETGLRPVFMGQIASDHYSQAIKHWFPDAEVISSRGAMSDFDTIRCAKNIVISVSTFSWLAAWLSEAKSIHLPLLGIFNPNQRPDIHLLPTKDSRYHFYDFPVRKWECNERQVCDLLNVDLRFPKLSNTEVETRLIVARGNISYRTARLRYRVELIWRVLLQRFFGIGGSVILKL